MAAKSGMQQRIGDEAVFNATGKTWQEWFDLLDKSGCKKMPHKDIAALVAKKYAMPAWWSQMVAVTYEQSRGIRQAHEKPQGFEISVSKTIHLPRALVFNAWHDNKMRRQWLKNEIAIRKATPEKSLRITWSDDMTSLSVEFVAKGEGKTQVVVQHKKLADAKTAKKMKLFWKATLIKLEQVIKI
ncbi:MAG: SRPBCC domain-containing protein [Burkholderiales bacterium]